ncbi:MAG TPA: hypothetical protein VNG29_01365 [Candidatus Paceibacterota bacterium]|nr:hypothetical protein [Candidatus Paceibacterota bacterium]
MSIEEPEKPASHAPTNDKQNRFNEFKDDLDARLNAHLEKKRDKDEGKNEAIVLQELDILTKQPLETIRKKRESEGWKVVFGGPKTLTPPLPELKYGEEREIVVSERMKLVFDRKKPPEKK